MARKAQQSKLAAREGACGKAPRCFCWPLSVTRCDRAATSGERQVGCFRRISRRHVDVGRAAAAGTPLVPISPQNGFHMYLYENGRRRSRDALASHQELIKPSLAASFTPLCICVSTRICIYVLALTLVAPPLLYSLELFTKLSVFFFYNYYFKNFLMTFFFGVKFKLCIFLADLHLKKFCVCVCVCTLCFGMYKSFFCTS